MGGIYHEGNYYAGANANDRAPKSIITSDTAYNPSKSYVAGDWFIDGDVLYEVKTACQGITPPNATYYEVKTVHDLKSEIDALNSKLLRMVTVTIGTVTLTATGYLDISAYRPTLQSGERVITAGVSYWSTMNPVAGFSVTEPGQYILGSPNQTITGLIVRYVIGRVPIN